MSIILYVNVVYMLIYVVNIYLPIIDKDLKCIALLRTENTYTLKSFNTFIFKAFEIRNTYNYT